MNLKYIASAVLCVCGIAIGKAGDCGPTLQSVTVNDIEMYTSQGYLNVSFNLDFSGISLGRNQQVVYTPLVMATDGSSSTALEKIVLNGRNVAIREERSPKTRVAGAKETIRRHNGTSQSVTYSGTVPFQPWMEKCNLILSEDLCGCGDLQSQDKRDLALFDNTPAPQIVLLYVEPEVEATKARAEKGSAFVDFVVNTVDIRPDYRNNRAELDKIIATIDLVKDDANVTITEINIHGYASPEGPWDRNVWLAEHRAESLMEYVKSLYTIPTDVFTSASTPEDWEGLRRDLLGSDIPDRQAILDIVDSTTLDPDAKDWKIKSDYPSTYAFMLREWYPALRHSDYTVNYTVRPFTVEEALAVMKVTPKQVSLNEMFMVAQTFTPGSPEYNEVMQIAVQTYPDDSTANLNAAISAINAGDYESARRYLSKVPESADSLNAAAVIELNSGNLDEAETLFVKAQKAGHRQAATNRGVVKRMRELQKINR